MQRTNRCVREIPLPNGEKVGEEEVVAEGIAATGGDGRGLVLNPDGTERDHAAGAAVTPSSSPPAYGNP